MFCITFRPRKKYNVIGATEVVRDAKNKPLIFPTAKAATQHLHDERDFGGVADWSAYVHRVVPFYIIPKPKTILRKKVASCLCQ